MQNDGEIRKPDAILDVNRPSSDEALPKPNLDQES